MLTPGEMLEELLRFKEASEAKTNDFVRQKHDADLCPRFLNHVNTILNSYTKYNHIAHDTQSPRDRGIDIILKMQVREGPEVCVGIQIKSYDDLMAPDWSKTIKAQVTDARAYLGERLARYYLVLCTDSIIHRKSIRSISADLAADDQIRIVSPQFAHTFLALSPTRITAFVERNLRAEDYVHTAGVGSRRHSPGERDSASVEALRNARAIDGPR